MEFQSIQLPDGVKTIPGFAEHETELVVVRDRAFKVVDKELRREGCHSRLHGDGPHGNIFSLNNNGLLGHVCGAAADALLSLSRRKHNPVARCDHFVATNARPISARPGRAPVCVPRSMTTVPLTMV